MTNDDFWENAPNGEEIDLLTDERFQTICLAEIRRSRELCYRLNMTNPLDDEYRAILSRLFMCEVDASTTIEANVQVDYGRQVRVGKNVFIGNGFAASSFGGVTIGDGAMIGFRCSIATVNHSLDNLTKASGKAVSIGKGAWLGANVTVLPGVTIGDGAVVGAGSVVTNDVPPLAVVVGNPAHIIKYRKVAP